MAPHTHTITLPPNTVILPRKTYDQLMREMADARREIERLRQEEAVLTIVAQGDQALRDGKTIVARSSKTALKQWYGKR